MSVSYHLASVAIPLLSRISVAVRDTSPPLGGLAPACRGNQEIWMRFSPDVVDAFPRGRDDSVFTVMSPEAKTFVRKYHHALIGAGLSEVTCDAIQSLRRRRLIGYRPLAFLAALMDGGFVNHPAWLPTEIYETEEARQYHGEQLRHLFWTEKVRAEPPDTST